ncbi:4-hydroxybutyrate dehydrogenase [Anaeromicropila herbilytica]|uniref:4-hydroxybutyrate dehydrogenase n=1 Tax=Anaeromicropila herbilytica TaxID=2785025 RepID=A0A7R7EJM7_9FIRM|nr:4-hydroxybutyrate dehydrogenase [Anaeromicropila herbilytica]BCN30056.1 4-hydroxybutyrate dehydrogenase [Anaeromicropila herbilytica]
MIQFRLKTTIQIYHKCKDFCKETQIGSGDLIITSGHIYENYLNGLIGEATLVNLREYGSGEPNDKMVESILADIKDNSYRRVIAIGGGSILDVAKLFVLKHISPVQDLFERKLPIIKEKELIMVPTTCGTGSEVTNISILELLEKKTKMGLATDELFADYAVLIPELLETLPFQSFGTSSIDAFIHAIESYLSPKANEFTKMYSKKAIELILQGYQIIVQQGEEARVSIMEKFLLASTYAGIAFGNAGCAAVHALSYPLGAKFHIPHGESNYVVFLGVFERYMRIDPNGEIKELNEFLSDVLGVSNEKVYKKMEELFHSIIPKKSLSSYGVTSEQLEEFTDSVMINQGRLLANNYVELSKKDIFEIYQSVF